MCCRLDLLKTADVYMIWMNTFTDPLKTKHVVVVCRVLRPPGGGSSNIFGGYEDDAGASRKPNKMASNVFAPPEPTESAPKRTNPPGQA